MSKDLIRYDLLVQNALKSVVRKVLGDAAKDGLGGDHHFYVSFRTDYPGVRVSNRLREKYPQDMTIVLQHQFWDLGVTEHTFEVGLSFSGVPERLLVPFDALTGFFDPSVQFGLKFEIGEGEASGASTGNDAAAVPPSAAAPANRPTRGAGSEPTEIRPKKSAVPVAAKSIAPKVPTRPAPEAPRPEKGNKTPKLVPPEPATGDKDAPASGAEVVSLDSFRKKS
jgi:hypothetical protein